MSKVDKYIDLYNDVYKNVTEIWPKQRRNNSCTASECSVSELFKGFSVSDIERVNAAIEDGGQCEVKNTEKDLTVEDVCTTMAYAIAVSCSTTDSELSIVCDTGSATKVIDYFDNSVLHPYRQPTIYNTPWLLFAYIQYAKRKDGYITYLNLDSCFISRFYLYSKTTDLIDSWITLSVDSTKHNIDRFKGLAQKYISINRVQDKCYA